LRHRDGRVSLGSFAATEAGAWSSIAGGGTITQNEKNLATLAGVTVQRITITTALRPGRPKMKTVRP